MSGREARAFGREVLRRRSALGLTQAELAGRSRLTAIYVGRVENEKMRRGPSLAAAFKLARGLDATLADMLGGSQKLGPVGVEAGRMVEALPRPVRGLVVDLLRALGKEAPQ